MTKKASRRRWPRQNNRWAKISRKLYQEIHKLERELTRSIPLAFPTGSVVTWDHGNHVRSATVVGHTSFGHRVRVESPAGKCYWVDYGKLLP